MGYFPKHIKVRRHKRNMNAIATAALSGAEFIPCHVAIHLHLPGRTLRNQLGGELRILWRVRYPGNLGLGQARSKSLGALAYLRWFNTPPGQEYYKGGAYRGSNN